MQRLELFIVKNAVYNKLKTKKGRKYENTGAEQFNKQKGQSRWMRSQTGMNKI
jgi:hypothetical protein